MDNFEEVTRGELSQLKKEDLVNRALEIQANLVERLQAVSAELETQREETATLTSDLVTTQEQLVELEGDLTISKADIVELAKLHEEETASQARDLAALHERANEYAERVTDTTNRLESAETTMQQKDREIADLRGSLATNEAELTTLRARVVEQENQLKRPAEDMTAEPSKRATSDTVQQNTEEVEVDDEITRLEKLNNREFAHKQLTLLCAEPPAYLKLWEANHRLDPTRACKTSVAKHMDTLMPEPFKNTHRHTLVSIYERLNEIMQRLGIDFMHSEFPLTEIWSRIKHNFGAADLHYVQFPTGLTWDAIRQSLVDTLVMGKDEDTRGQAAFKSVKAADCLSFSAYLQLVAWINEDQRIGCTLESVLEKASKLINPPAMPSIRKALVDKDPRFKVDGLYPHIHKHWRSQMIVQRAAAMNATTARNRFSSTPGRSTSTNLHRGSTPALWTTLSDDAKQKRVNETLAVCVPKGIAEALVKERLQNDRCGHCARRFHPANQCRIETCREGVFQPGRVDRERGILTLESYKASLGNGPRE